MTCRRFSSVVTFCIASAACVFARRVSRNSPTLRVQSASLSALPQAANGIGARALAQKLSETIGQQVVVDNRPGAASMLGAELVAHSAPDGYTLLFANATIAMPSLFAKLPFDVQKDLRPVTLVGYGPLALTVHPSLPVKSVKELVALAKRNPGELNYASAGAGSFTHLAMALFTTLTHTNLVHVPYKGGGPSAIATMAGETSSRSPRWVRRFRSSSRKDCERLQCPARSAVSRCLRFRQ